MSVIGKSLKDTTPVEVAQPVLIAGTVGPGGAVSAGSVTVSGGDGANPATQINPLPVAQAQGVIISGPFTLAANTAATIIGAFADRRKFRVLNWIAAPVYLSYGTTGTPPSGAGSDYIPAAQTIGGFLVPGQYEPLILPVGGMRAVCAVAGDLTIQAA